MNGAWVQLLVLAFSIFCYWRLLDTEELEVRVQQFGFKGLVQFHQTFVAAPSDSNATHSAALSAEAQTLLWWIAVRTGGAKNDPTASSVSASNAAAHFDFREARADMERVTLPPPRGTLISSFNVSVNATGYNITVEV
jgi:hypothetical protein